MAGGTGQARTRRGMRPRVRDAFDWVRTRTTSSPARFAVVVFLSLILIFTALLSLPAAAADGGSGRVLL